MENVLLSAVTILNHNNRSVTNLEKVAIAICMLFDFDLFAGGGDTPKLLRSVLTPPLACQKGAAQMWSITFFPREQKVPAINGHFAIYIRCLSFLSKPQLASGGRASSMVGSCCFRSWAFAVAAAAGNGLLAASGKPRHVRGGHRERAGRPEEGVRRHGLFGPRCLRPGRDRGRLHVRLQRGLYRPRLRPEQHSGTHVARDR